MFAKRSIDLTLAEACYLRMIVNERMDYLKRHISRYERYSSTREDALMWEKKKALVECELHDLEHVYSELALFISQTVILSGLLTEFEDKN